MSVTQYINRAIDEDVPRIVRSDMTELTELAAKYRSLEARLSERGLEDASEQASKVGLNIARAREALEQLVPLLATAAAPNVTGVGDTRADPPSFDEKPAVGTPTTGKVAARLITTVLVEAGFVSSSVVAKRAIRAGVVSVNGETVRLASKVLEPGDYVIRFQDNETDLTVA